MVIAVISIAVAGFFIWNQFGYNKKAHNAAKVLATDLAEEYPEAEYGNRGTKVPPVEALPSHKRSRVSRFQAMGTMPRSCLPESETIIIEWPSGGHNGGEAIIGPDGYLYISTGDGSVGSDPKQTGQGVDDLLAVIMRLDVDHPSDGKAYSIPSDNPFVDFPGYDLAPPSPKGYKGELEGNSLIR